MSKKEILKSAELMYENDNIKFSDYIAGFNEDEISAAIKNAKMYYDEDFASCAFLGFLDGITFTKQH